MPENPTLELVVQKLDALIFEVRRSVSDHEDRLRTLENERMPALEQKVGQLSERLSLWQLGQAVFTSVVGVVSSAIGIRVR